ncbi:MAG: CRISPR-associated endonuclease Cas3'' [Rhizobiales bacterium]|nr:CRISPR-associated endonuclease Cas3'' [Hyphomicrobiales bacterium]MBN9010395.1 CRISPR-associated endonuclease Cas3'' [Hyphomicrobiales bacterium]
MRRFFAHSTEAADKHDWQPMPEHAIGVADLAAQFGARFGLERAARLAGLLHDLGKYNPAFQIYIERAGKSSDRVDHSTAGAWWARELAKEATPHDRLMVELVAYCIAGHHAGLPDRFGTPSSLDERLKAYVDAVDPVWRSELAPDLTRLLPALKWVQAGEAHPLGQERFAFQLAMLGRMLFSCLVDADFRETESFYARVEGREIDRSWPALPELLDGLIVRFDAHMAAKAASDTAINRLRSDILGHVRGKAALPPGFVTLTVPTGGGKTLASLGFALDHARRHGHRRIILAVPFTTVAEQAAGIFGEVLGEGIVLEHHSAIEDEHSGPADDADSRDQSRRLRRAMEDWEAPVVVTTNVQLFESLFAARTSRARKLHNIAGSVIVLDEAQAIPLPLLGPAVWALEALVRDWGCTVVLCTATQPALDRARLAGSSVAGLIGLDLGPARELAPDSAGLASQLRRTTLRHAGPLADEELVAALRDAPQALVIVNSRRHALALYRTVKAAGLDGVVHLSTRHYAVDRRRILAEVRQRLKAGEPCRLIATSLVEAGVDLDFPRGWRAEAGLDQIVQAAGRVNRNGLRPVEDSIVTVFEAPDNRPPPEIAGFIGDRKRMQDRFDDLFSPEAMTRYFEEVYWRKGPAKLDRGHDGRSILDRFRLDVGETAFSYRSAAENFHMIESGMVPVIVPGDDIATRAINELSIERIPTGLLARTLQPYTVAVPPRARTLLFNHERIRFVAPEFRGEAFAVLTDSELYDPEVGLLWENPEYMNADTLII